LVGMKKGKVKEKEQLTIMGWDWKTMNQGQRMWKKNKKQGKPSGPKTKQNRTPSRWREKRTRGVI